MRTLTIRNVEMVFSKVEKAIKKMFPFPSNSVKENCKRMKVFYRV